MMELWPFTNFHDLNLDWLISKWKKLEDNLDDIHASMDAAADSAEAADVAKIDAQAAAADAHLSANSANIARAYIESKASQIDVNTAAINEYINGSTSDANAELLNVRVAYNGETYDTAGNAVRGQISDLEENFTRLNWWYEGEFATNNFNGVTIPVISEGRFVLNGQNVNSSNVYSKNLYIPAGQYTLRLRRVSGTSTAGMPNFDPKIQLKDINLQAIGGRVSPDTITNTEALFDVTMTDSGYIQLVGFLSANTTYTNYTIEIILVQNEVEPVLKYANFKTILSDAVRSVRGNVLWYAADGDDNAPGTVERPKKDPVAAIAEGEHIILLRSGDTFEAPLGIHPGSNTYIGTYGGPTPATFNCEYTNTDQFTVYDTDEYVVDVNTNNIGYIKIDGVKYWNRVPALNMMDEEMAYYLDPDARKLYVHTSRNIAGKTLKYSRKINGCTISGVENVNMHGVKILAAGAHGIRVDNSENIDVTFNEVAEVGGCYLTTNNPLGYGNGIEVWMEDCHNITVENNTCTEVFDTGITPQVGSQVSNTNSDHITIRNNLIKRCQAGIEEYNTGTATTVKNILIENNRITELEDVSGGYRRNSTVGQVPFANMYAQASDTILIFDNVAVTPGEYAVHYMESPGNTPEKIQMKNNTIVVDGPYTNIDVEPSGKYARCNFNDLKETGAYMGLLNK